jgi:hypothetical protein
MNNPLLLVPIRCRRSSRGSRSEAGVQGEGWMMETLVMEMPWQGHEDVASSLGADDGAVGSGSSRGVGGGLAQGQKQCLPGAQHGIKSLSECHGAA